MNLWKKIRMMFLIGLGIFTVSINGQDGQDADEKLPTFEQLLLKSQVQFELTLAKAIEQRVNVVSKVSDLSIIKKHNKKK